MIVARTKSPLVRAWLSAIGALVLFSAAAAARQRVSVDIEKHFPGIVAAFDSDYSSLYRFDDFWKLEGRSLVPAELERWQETWRAEVVRVEAELERMRADPGAHLDFLLRVRLKRHHYFRDHFGEDDFKVVFDYPPFVLYIQRAKTDDSRFDRAEVQRYGEWLQKLERTFRTEYAGPLGLEQHHEVPGYALFLLHGREEYEEYARQHQDAGLYLARAHYDSRYRIGVTYQDRNARAEDADEIHSAMHEMVHALQGAYHVHPGASSELGLQTPAWFNEGFAEYFAYRLRRKEGGFADTVPVLPPHELETLVRQVGEPAAACILPFRELAMLTTYGEAIETFVRKIQARGAIATAPDMLLSLLYRQSDLWMHYLHDGADGRYRPAVQAYVREVLGGKSNSEALASSFGDVSMSALDEGFLEFLGENRVSPEVLRVIRKTRADTTAPTGRADAGFTIDPEPLEPAAASTYGLRELTLGADLRFAALLQMARRGRYSAAEDKLAALLESGDAAGGRDRFERELERIRSMVALRVEFLEHLAAIGKKLQLQVEGRRLLDTVVRVQDGFVEFGGSNRLGIRRMALDDIDPVELVDFMRSSKAKFDAPWTCAYAYVLAGDRESWVKALKDAPSGSDSLRADAEADYPARLAQGPLAEAMEAIAASDAPTTAAEAEAVLVLLEEISLRFGKEPAVLERRADLRAVAGYAAALLFPEGDVAALVQGRVESLPGERIRLSYAFDDAKEALDFVAEVPADVEAAVADMPLPEVSAGGLRLRGFHLLRHKLDFDAPLTLKATVRLPKGSPEDSWFQLGVCDNREGAGVGFNSIGLLYALDPMAPFESKGYAEGWPTGKAVKVELEHTGSMVVARLDGELASQVGVGPLQSGTVHLLSISPDTVELLDLSLEARVSQAFWDRGRARFVEERLEKLGL